MSEEVQILKEIEKAAALCEKTYTREEIFELLKIDSDTHPQTDIEKQICILKLADIRSQQEADLLVHHQTQHHGLIREACAQKLNEFLPNPLFNKYFQTKQISNTLLKAVNDINPNICRLIIEVLPAVKDKQYLLDRLYERFGEIFAELEKLKRSNWYTKKLFNLYWGLEALGTLCPECDTRLQNVIGQCLKIREYTIREKTAMILSGIDSQAEFITHAKQELAKDNNYYVQRYSRFFS